MGRTLCDRYRVDSVIGTGGQGAVCRGYDPKLEREVAVKVMTALPGDPGEAARMRGRFYREARAAARLRHPNVVTVHDFGTDPELGIDFLVMELLVGESLAERMRRAAGPLAVAETLEILQEGGLGLAAGHRAHLVHRDVKPGNVYLVAEPGGWEVKLLDFGIAQFAASDQDTDTPLTVAGAPHTPRYASPEQLRGERSITPASDVYSLALAGLEMLGGAYPDGVNTDTGDRAAVRAVKRIVDARPDVPLTVAAVLRRALRLDPTARFPDAGAFLEALAECDLAAPSATTATRRAFAATRDPGPAASSDATLYAPPADGTVGTLLDPGFRPPPPVAAPPASPASAAPAAKDAPAPQPARRPWRPRTAFWIFLLVLVMASSIAILLGRLGPRGEPGTRAPTERKAPAPANPDRIAREEAQRVTRRHGAHEGDALWMVVLASFDAADEAEARAMRDGLRERGYDVGLANSRVYPELLTGYVVVVAGPFDHDEADAELERMRGQVAGDAFLKRLTLRTP